MTLFLPLLNAGLLFFLIWLVWKRLPTPQNQRLWLGYAALKILAAIGFVWIYRDHYGTGDMLNYIHDAKVYRTLDIGGFISSLISPRTAQDLLEQLKYDLDPRAMLMAKITAIAYYMSGSIWLTALNFSLFGGLVIFRFYLVLNRVFNSLTYPAIGAFLLFPSFLFWTSGICKEAVSVPAMLLVMTPLLQMRIESEKVERRHWIMAVFGALFLWLLKYYVAAIVLPACLLYGWLIFFDWVPYRKLVTGAAAYIALLLMVSQLHPNLYLHRTMQVMVDNYELTISQTQPEKTAHYEGLTPDVLSFAWHFPEAVFTGLFRPLLGQQWDLPSFMVVAQNSLLLLTMIFVLVGISYKRLWWSVPSSVWGLAILIILLSGLIAITTPNFGTLDRYRVAYQPFLVLLVLAGFQQLIPYRKIP